MAKVIVSERHLADIGNAIRQKLGVETSYLPSEMPAAIASIRSSTAAEGSESPPSTLSAYVQITEQLLTDIADAIRAALDVTTSYLPSQMAAAIKSIPHQPAVKTLTGISVAVYNNDYTIYQTNASFNTTDMGLYVTAHYSDGSSENVTERSVVSPANGTTLTTDGVQWVTVSYTENGVTETAKFPIMVAPSVFRGRVVYQFVESSRTIKVRDTDGLSTGDVGWNESTSELAAVGATL